LIRSTRAEPIASAQLLGRVDHLVYATPDLSLGIEKLEKLLGVRATPGGQHLGRGTRNALIALGPFSYLELLGPDPEQPKPERPRWFGIDELEVPRLVGWAANGKDLDQLASEAALHGVTLGAVAFWEPETGRRACSWCFTDPLTVLADGIVPFFIDWGQTPHPARSAVQGTTLVDLSADAFPPKTSPRQAELARTRSSSTGGPPPALIALITGPRGRVELHDAGTVRQGTARHNIALPIRGSRHCTRF
jgi:Glyoxalase-like domain